jgi:hypothetical protein
VLEIVDPTSGEKSTVRCQFDVDETGVARRFGVDLYPETGGLIWFDRME